MALSTRDHVKPSLKQLHWPLATSRTANLVQVMSSERTTFIPVRLHNIWVTVSPRSLHPWTGTDSDSVTRLTTYCREHAPSLANVVSTTLVRPPGTLCHLTYMTLLTLAYSRNDLKLLLTNWDMCVGRLAKSHYMTAGWPRIERKTSSKTSGQQTLPRTQCNK